MVLPTVLKRKHSLKGLNLVPLVRRLRTVTESENDMPKDLARADLNTDTESLSNEEMKQSFHAITGEEAVEMLDLAHREENTSNLRLLIHHTVIMANEVGQPRGQTLVVSSLQNFWHVYIYF